MIMPLDDDMILHVAPASAGTPVTHLAKAFIVPKNTLVKMNAAIWHLAPLPATKDALTAMIILPECTYANDCTVVDLAEDEQFEILL
jgi:ureidoglycolate lyase